MIIAGGDEIRFPVAVNVSETNTRVTCADSNVRSGGTDPYAGKEVPAATSVQDNARSVTNGAAFMVPFPRRSVRLDARDPLAGAVASGSRASSWESRKLFPPSVTVLGRGQCRGGIARGIGGYDVTSGGVEPKNVLICSHYYEV